METLAKINKPAQQRSVAQFAPGGKLLPAVGVLQKKGGPEEELPSQGQFIIQKAGMPDEEPLQKKGGPEEELPVQGKFVAQMAAMPDEEPLQKKGGPEEELPAQGKFVLQKVGLPGEEPLQKKGAEEELPAQGKFVVQKLAVPEDEPLQGRFVPPVQQKKKSDTQTTGISPFNPIQKKANNTGLPDNLKSGIEQMSGHDLSDVKVHYNSSKPAQLNAHAYAQGTDIHIGPGQEKHLPHEAWHVVQQKQGRVKATMQMKGGVPVNDDAGLENEADAMGGKALQMKKDPQPGHHAAVVQLYNTPARARLSDYGIGRAQNAGIRDSNIEVSGTRITEHYHCNGWSERTRNFTGFTGTFRIGARTYHYNMVDVGNREGWDRNPGATYANPLRDRTRYYLGVLTAPA